MADVFISHSSKDKEIANLICEALESNGIKCWIAPRDIEPGADWSARIAAAIHNTKVFIIIYSKNSASSSQVPREITLAGSSNAVIIPYKADDAQLTPNFEYYLMSSHWVNADAANQDFKLDELFRAVKFAISDNDENDNPPEFNQSSIPVININNYNVQNAVNQNAVSQTNNPKKSSGKTLAVVGIILGVIILAFIIMMIVAFSSGIIKVSNDNNGGTAIASPAVSGGSSSKFSDYMLSPEEKMPIQNYEVMVFNKDTLNSYDDITYTGYGFFKDGYVGFDNLENYTTLKFTAFLGKGVEEKFTLLVKLDGKDKQLIEFTPNDKQEHDYVIDITGAKTVLLSVIDSKEDKCLLAIKNVYFSKSGAAPESFNVAEKPIPNTAYSPKDKIPYITGYVVTANNSVNYATVNDEKKFSGFAFNPDGFMEYDNWENYKHLTLSVASMNADKASFFIEIDDEIVYNGVAGNTPQTLEFDITDAENICIASVNIEELDSDKQCLFIYDMSFSK